jgi:dCMP deaminase
MLRERISFDDYFMIQVLWTKVRSPDPSTQCGCLLVDKRGRPVGQGYNGYPRGIDDSKMPQTRPEKYPPILHSEENAILNSTRDLDGATAYITGPPCTHCWAHMIQVGIKRVVYGPITTSSKGMYFKEAKEGYLTPVVQDMLENHDIEIVQWEPKNLQLILEELDRIRQLIIADNVMNENDKTLKKLAKA